MRCVSRPSILVLLVLAGLVGVPSGASASDANLKALVTKQAAAEKKLGKASIRSPNSRSPKAFSRYYRRAANLFERQEETYDRFRTAFAHEVAETPEVERGRILVLRGLRDESEASNDLAHAFRRAASRVLKYRFSQRGLRSAQRKLSHDVSKTDTRGTRGDKRVKSGSRIIRDAPTPTPPATPVP